MHASKVIKVSIARPYAEVYEFLANPHNFAKWAGNPGSGVEPLDGGDWLVQLATGSRAIRFAPRNNFGVLDFETFAPGEKGGPMNPVRLIRNGDGCEVIFVWLQRPGMIEDRFRSDAEWVEMDLQRLKTLLEGG